MTKTNTRRIPKNNNNKKKMNKSKKKKGGKNKKEEQEFHDKCVKYLRRTRINVIDKHGNERTIRVPFESNPIGMNLPAHTRRGLKKRYEKGQSDLSILVQQGNFAGFLIELKRNLKEGRLKPEQRTHLENTRMTGYLTAVVRCYEHFKIVVNDYLEGKRMKSLQKWCEGTF